MTADVLLADDLTPSQEALLRGACGLLDTQGRTMMADDGTVDDIEVVAIVRDEPMLPDLMEHATVKAKKILYATVKCLTGVVEDPRAVLSFLETTGAERLFTVTGFEEDASDRIWWRWKCEAQRK